MDEDGVIEIGRKTGPVKAMTVIGEWRYWTGQLKPVLMSNPDQPMTMTQLTTGQWKLKADGPRQLLNSQLDQTQVMKLKAELIGPDNSSGNDEPARRTIVTLWTQTDIEEAMTDEGQPVTARLTQAQLSPDLIGDSWLWWTQLTAS